MCAEAIVDQETGNRSPWYGHAGRKEENDWEKLRRLPSDQSKETWQATMLAEMKALGIDQEMVMDRSRWEEVMARIQSNLAIHGKRTPN